VQNNKAAVTNYLKYCISSGKRYICRRV